MKNDPTEWAVLRFRDITEEDELVTSGETEGGARGVTSPPRESAGRELVPRRRLETASTSIITRGDLDQDEKVTVERRSRTYKVSALDERRDHACHLDRAAGWRG